MKYYVAINKKYQYVKVYSMLKRVNETSNPFSRAVASLIDKYFLKREKSETELK